MLRAYPLEAGANGLGAARHPEEGARERAIHRIHSPAMNDRRDSAAIGSLEASIQAILPSLEQFLQFEGPDPARERSAWLAALDRPLPSAGVGRDETLRELAEVVIANGLRVGHPGFSGWVTTDPTDVGAAADLAQAVAVPQRWWSRPGTSRTTSRCAG